MVRRVKLLPAVGMVQCCQAWTLTGGTRCKRLAHVLVSDVTGRQHEYCKAHAALGECLGEVTRVPEPPEGMKVRHG